MVPQYVKPWTHALLRNPNRCQGVEKTTLFTAEGNKYYCVGAQPGQAAQGVQPGLYNLKCGFGAVTGMPYLM